MEKTISNKGGEAETPAELIFRRNYAFKKWETLFWISHFPKIFKQCHKAIIKSLKSDVLSGFGRPGVF